MRLTRRQAGDIVAQLKKGIALKATVLRDGKESELEAREIVPGDILILEEGQTIPADAKVGLVTQDVLIVDYSFLR